MGKKTSIPGKYNLSLETQCKNEEKKKILIDGK